MVDARVEPGVGSAVSAVRVAGIDPGIGNDLLGAGIAVVGGAPLLTGERQLRDHDQPAPPPHCRKVTSRTGGGKAEGGPVSAASVYGRSA